MILLMRLRNMVFIFLDFQFSVGEEIKWGVSIVLTSPTEKSEGYFNQPYFGLMVTSV